VDMESQLEESPAMTNHVSSAETQEELSAIVDTMLSTQPGMKREPRGSSGASRDKAGSPGRTFVNLDASCRFVFPCVCGCVCVWVEVGGGGGWVCMLCGARMYICVCVCVCVCVYVCGGGGFFPAVSMWSVVLTLSPFIDPCFSSSLSQRNTIVFSLEMLSEARTWNDSSDSGLR
jgi:hypothetical protein